MRSATAKLLFKRIISSVIILFLIITFLFFLVRISPGDPVQKFVNPTLSPKLAEQVRASLNLDKPLYMQYIGFLTSALQGDLGVSYSFRRNVISVILEYLPFTLIFTTISFVIQMIVSFWLSIKSVKKINGFLDKTLSNLTLLIYATPVFVIGVFLVFIFSELLNISPSSGASSFDSAEFNFWTRLIDYALSSCASYHHSFFNRNGNIL